MKLVGSLLVASAALACTAQGAVLRGSAPVKVVDATGMAATGATGVAATTEPSKPALGVPNVVLKSMGYVIKASTASIEKTNADLAFKIRRFDERVIDEKKVLEKTALVVKQAKACQTTAANNIKKAKDEIESLNAQKIPQEKLTMASNAIEAAEASFDKAQHEFNNDETLFKHDMTHLDAVKNESTRVIQMMNNHFLHKQNLKAGKGMMPPKRTVEHDDQFHDLVPGKGHVIVGTQAHNIAFLLETAAKHGLDTEDNMYARIAVAMRHAAKATPEEMAKATTHVPVMKPAHGNPKFYARAPAVTSEVSSNKTTIHKVDGEPEAPSGGDSPGRMKVKAMGNSVKVGKDVGGHIIAAVTKLHGFVKDHAAAREEAYELATKPVRKELKHAAQEKARITALLMEYKATNKRLAAEIETFKKNIVGNEKDMAACKSDEHRANIGAEDARTKLASIEADVKSLKGAYKVVTGDLKQEKKQAQYVVSLLNRKLDVLAKYLAKAKAVAETKDAIIKANFTDPDLPKYEGMPFALKCDPLSTPEEWCKSPEMMVRCGVTKESCDTYHFKSTAIPNMEVVPSTTSKEVSGTHWPKATRTTGKNVVDARSIDELKRDGVVSVNAF
jgi:hypothetical protein